MDRKILLLISTIVVAIILGLGISMYARGFRFNLEDNEIRTNGILVMKSSPDPAQIFINGELETVTDATIDLEPATYDIRIQKEGYYTWEKRIEIRQEEVTEATAHLFKSAPSLTATTFSSAINPTPSLDFSKLAYVVAPSTESTNEEEDKAGLWVIETINLPVGFSRDPRQVTDGDLTQANWEWSPDGREILLTTKSGVYLLDAGTFTAQNQRVNITSQEESIREEWIEERNKKLNSKLKSMPEPLDDFLENNTKAVVFSPDEDVILYISDGSITLEDELVKPFPGASNQKQERDIKPNRVYIYDIEEDRNYLIDESAESLVIGDTPLEGKTRRIVWFPTSRHLVLAEPNKIIIMDHDGTNRVEVYSGSYLAPHAYPMVGIDKMVILTNLGAGTAPENLYSLSLK